MTKEKVTWLVIGVLAGVVFSRQINRLPLVDKLPQV
jgi:hypothetical protein